MVTVKLEMTLSLQVIVVALVLSFIIKRDSEVIDYEDAFGKMKTVDYINLKGERFRCSDGGAENAGVEKAGVEKSGANRRAGKCGSGKIESRCRGGKCRSAWKSRER